MQLQQYQTKEEKQTSKKNPPVTHTFCSCGYVLSPTDKFCPQCGKQNNEASNTAFAVAPEEKKEVKKQPETLSKVAAEEIFNNIDEEIRNSNVEAILNRFEQHSLFVREKNLHQMAQEQIQNHFRFINDKQYSQQEPEYLARITQQIRAATIKPGFSFAETESSIQQSESQLQILMLQKQKENEALIQLEREAIASEIAAMETEKKRRELELQRQIKMEEERRRIEKEKLLRSFVGFFSNAHNCPCGGYLHENLCIRLEYKNGLLIGQKTYKWSPNCGFKDGLYAGTIYTAELDVKLTGNSINLTEISFGFISNPHNLTPAHFKHNFEGTISSDGTLITGGHWFDDAGNSDGYYDYFKFK